MFILVYLLDYSASKTCSYTFQYYLRFPCYIPTLQFFSEVTLCCLLLILHYVNLTLNMSQVTQDVFGNMYVCMKELFIQPARKTGMYMEPQKKQIY